MARVCVIGGSGFLGSHVADALSAAGHQVCIYDRRPSSWLNGDQEAARAAFCSSESFQVKME